MLQLRAMCKEVEEKKAVAKHCVSVFFSLLFAKEFATTAFSNLYTCPCAPYTSCNFANLVYKFAKYIHAIFLLFVFCVIKYSYQCQKNMKADKIRWENLHFSGYVNLKIISPVVYFQQRIFLSIIFKLHILMTHYH